MHQLQRPKTWATTTLVSAAPGHHCEHGGAVLWQSLRTHTVPWGSAPMSHRPTTAGIVCLTNGPLGPARDYGHHGDVSPTSLLRSPPGAA